MHSPLYSTGCIIPRLGYTVFIYSAGPWIQSSIFYWVHNIPPWMHRLLANDDSLLWVYIRMMPVFWGCLYSTGEWCHAVDTQSSEGVHILLSEWWQSSENVMFYWENDSLPWIQSSEGVYILLGEWYPALVHIFNPIAAHFNNGVKHCFFAFVRLAYKHTK